MRPSTLVYHELIGRRVAVESAANTDLVGISGQIIRETTNTLVIRPGDGPLGDATNNSRRVPKRGATFVFTLADGTAVRVSGERLIARPARRSEAGGVSPWV